MKLSLNEIDNLGKKAARGANLSWGLAEDAGKAARWLSARGFCGLAILASLLRDVDGVDYEQLVPEMRAGTWRGSRQTINPLIAGPALSDYAHSLLDSDGIRMLRVRHPEFLVPFASYAAGAIGTTVGLSWAGCQLYMDPLGGVLSRNFRSERLESADSVLCRAADMPPGLDAFGRAADFDVGENVWNYLDGLASRIYVPESEASRLVGAGAGLHDTD
jgi:hypothetical protein